jgi:NAD(P)H-dependent FMN reductase
MNKILVFSGSNSSSSINQQLVTYVSSLLEESPSTLIHLRDFPLPLFGVDDEQSEGVPDHAKALEKEFAEHDAFIISVSEHNQSVSAVFKNTLDWISRAGESYKVLAGKPVFLLSTSPGAAGAQRALSHAADILRGLGAEIASTLSVPSFYEKVKIDEKGIQLVDQKIAGQIEAKLYYFEQQLLKRLIA